MYAQVEKSKENKSRSVANSVAQKKSNGKQGFGLVDNRLETITQRKLNSNIKYKTSPVQGAFWHIDPGQKSVSEEQRVTVKRLMSNEQFNNDEDVKGLDDIDNSLSRRDVEKAPTGVGEGKEDLYVMSHGSQTGAGKDGGQPWIGGMVFSDFAAQLTRRYGGNVEGKTIWLMSCLVGGVLKSMAEELVEVGLTNVTIMAPDSFMFVSDKGIPHVYATTDVDHEDLDRNIAKNNANYYSLSYDRNWLGTGLGWSGYTIDNGGSIAPIAKELVIKMVLEKFDIGEDGEWDDEDSDYTGTFDLWEKEEKIKELKAKAKKDYNSLFEMHAFTIEGAAVYEDDRDHILVESIIAINGAQGEEIDGAYKKGLSDLQKLCDSVE